MYIAEKNFYAIHGIPRTQTKIFQPVVSLSAIYVRRLIIRSLSARCLSVSRLCVNGLTLSVVSVPRLSHTVCHLSVRRLFFLLLRFPSVFRVKIIF